MFGNRRLASPRTPREVSMVVELHAGERCDDVRAFRLIGELDLGTVPAFRRAVEPALSGSGDLILDGSELLFIDSEGIRAIAELSRRMGEDRRLVLAGLRATVHRVLEITQLPAVLRNLDVVERRARQLDRFAARRPCSAPPDEELR